MSFFARRLGCLPNILTLVRISCVPVIVLCYYLPINGHAMAAMVFALAASTDWLDGYLARQLQQVSSFGAFLDPAADKLLVCVALLLILGSGDQDWDALLMQHACYGPIIATVPGIIIVCRELVVSSLREWMAKVGASDLVSVSYLGKLKTVLQMLALTVLLLCDRHTKAGMWYIGYVLLYSAALCALWSLWCYLRHAFSKNF